MYRFIIARSGRFPSTGSERFHPRITKIIPGKNHQHIQNPRSDGIRTHIRAGTAQIFLSIHFSLNQVHSYPFHILVLPKEEEIRNIFPKTRCVWPIFRRLLLRIFILCYTFNVMDEKTLHTLEYYKILERLAGYAAFSASADLARTLRPTADRTLAMLWQTQTSEARRLLDVNNDISVGGATDIRPQVEMAQHGGVLSPADLLEVKNTLIAARTLSRTFERLGTQFPALTEMAIALPPPIGLVDAISRTVSERGEVMDDASPQLASIRRELKVSHERLFAKLQRMLNDPRSSAMLQEPIITQRNGRYVVPLRAEFKGQLRSIVHDQSSSGATLFVEPLAIVELNNRWTELQLAERDEERRILAELSRQVGAQAEPLIWVVETLAHLDLAFMRAKYAEDLNASEPILRSFDPRPTDDLHPGSTIRLYDARHPLLDPKTVVPIDVFLDPDVYALMITGPNTGGKTVTLKTVGLMSLMAQSGMHIPVQSGSEISLFEDIYADIGDEQSIEQSLSTFSGHITNIVRILKLSDRHTLVLLDELGAGTDPQEGAALARSIVSNLLERSITNLVATHYPELKAYAHSTPGVVNASMEFDLRSLRPTYHLTIGLPGRSNALAIAERLGLPIDIVNAARSTINPDDLRADDLLAEIHHQRDLARQDRAAAEKARQGAEQKRAEFARQLDKADDERRTILEQARREAEDQLAELQRELDDVRRTLARARQPVDALKALEEKVDILQEKVERPVERKGPAAAAPRGKMRLGERVRVRSLRMEGVIISIGESEVEVQLGALRVRARLTDIQRKGEIPDPEPEEQPMQAKRVAVAAPAAIETQREVFHPSPGMELDLRGQRAEDALDALDRYLESAYLAGMPFVRIIHGKGTGRLRQVIREALKESPHVTSFNSGMDNEGGDGVTVAKMNSD